MSGPRMEVTGGGSPTADEAAAILSAAATVLQEEDRARSSERDPRPAAYRSAWRAAAVREGLRRHVPAT